MSSSASTCRVAAEQRRSSPGLFWCICQYVVVVAPWRRHDKALARICGDRCRGAPPPDRQLKYKSLETIKGWARSRRGWRARASGETTMSASASPRS